MNIPTEERFSNSNFSDVFGTCVSVHRVNRGWFDILAIPLVLVAMCLFAYTAYLGSRDWVVLPVCGGPFLLLLIGVIRHLFATKTDELKIYENGFTYRTSGRFYTCLWSEISYCRRRELNAREIGRGDENVIPLLYVKKKNGELIEFESDVDGTTEILKKFESR